MSSWGETSRVTYLLVSLDLRACEVLRGRQQGLLTYYSLETKAHFKF
jgi:hypothetical protein